MNRFVRPTLLALAGLLALAARAQQPATFDPALDARERERIAVERAAALAAYGREEEGCYQRFAVNDCLREVRKRRRVTMDELRRQEIILNDALRAHEAAERIRRAEERAAERASEAQAQQRAAAEQEHEARLERARQKRAEQEARQKQAAPAAGGAAGPVTAPVPQGSPAARGSAAQQAYEERQREAAERQRRIEQQKAEKAGGSRPLPVPP